MTQKREPLCRESEFAEIIPSLEPGDVILHRDDRFGAVNWFIGGVMIHAGIYVGNDLVVEAVSEGVKERHVRHILESDYTMVVRPIGLSKYARDRVNHDAVNKARAIVGCDYDPLFDFCDAVEFEQIACIQRGYVSHRWAHVAREAGITFCCTEIPYFCFYPVREQLGLFRRRNVSLFVKFLKWLGLHPGEAVIDADMYVTAHGFDLIWCSNSATPQWSAKAGASEAMMSKISAYWAVERK